MRLDKLRLLLRLMTIFMLIGVGGSIGCEYIFPYNPDPIPEKKWMCSVKLQKCALTQKDIANSFSTNIPQGNCYKDGFGVLNFDFWRENDPDAKKGLSQNDSVYCDPKWKVKKVGNPHLRGSHWIVTRFKDRRFDDPLKETKDFLRLSFQNPDDIEAVYLAYDSTATKNPDWLKPPAYEKADGFITIAKPGTGNSEVDLQLWRKQNITQPIPSNSYGNPSFPNNEPAMYVVIIKPKEEIKCLPIATAAVDKELWYQGCGTEEAEAKAAAISKCEDAKAEYDKCEETECTAEQECPNEEVVKRAISLKMTSWSFMRSSEIEFDPNHYTSQAIFTIDNKKYPPIDVNGTLHFEYLLDDFNGLSAMQINSMILHLKPFDTDAGHVSDTVIALLAPVRAECVDESAPWAQPCNFYVLAKNSVVVSEFAKIGGKKLLTVTRNKYPMTIAIDHVSRGFKLSTKTAGQLQPFAGAFQASIFVNGDEIPVKIDIDVYGHFRNFAPKAVTVESTDKVACKIGVSPELDKAPGGGPLKPFSSNAANIILTSVGSFEVYHDPIPNSAYNWYEDYGLVTERFLGQGPEVIIGPHQLSYGVHSITLVIRDDQGVASLDTFEIDVQDSLPPSLNIPPDIFIFPQQPGAIKVNIGKASATDLCSAAKEIEITNDAPKGNYFPSGVLTPVTWTADDSRGHMATGVQKIFVFKPPKANVVDHADLRPFVIELEKALSFIEEATLKNEARIAACDNVAICEADSKNLLEGVSAVVDMLGKISLPKGTQPLQSDIVAYLQEVKERLRASNTLVDQSNSAGEEVRRFRSEAIESLQGRAKFLLEAKRKLQLLKKQSPALK